MKITIEKSFRNLKAGDVYDFSEMLSALHSVTVVGDNGCGKSSLFQSIRGIKNDKKSSSMYESDFKELGKNISIDHNYEKIFFLDRIKDDGSNFQVAYDASGFMEAGGFHTKNKSHGESSLIYIDIFINKIKNDIIPGKTLLILDEIDAGFSLKAQSKFINLIDYLKSKYETDVIVITHNPFLILQSVIVYDLAEKQSDLGVAYIEKLTGYTISHDKSRS